MNARPTFALFLAVLLASCTHPGDEPSFAPETSPAQAQQPPQQPPPPPPHQNGYAAAPPAPAAALMAPVDPSLHAPATFTVHLVTSKGDVLIDVTRAWAPNGADRFYDLVRRGAYDDNAFFRVVSGFMAQVGIPGDPRVSAAWRDRHIPDDPVIEHNTRGSVTFATSGPNARVNQFFINLVDNSRLDPMGFAPFGRVRDMTAIDALYSGYGEGAPAGHGPGQAPIQLQGNVYLHQAFPQMDYIRTARIEGGAPVTVHPTTHTVRPRPPPPG